MPLIDIIGWLGSALVVYAYARNMFGKMRADSFSYYALNIAGSACLIANTLYHHAMPSAIVNIIWVLLAAWAMVRGKVR